MPTKKVILAPQEVVKPFHLKQVQDNFEAALQGLENKPLLTGVYVDAVLTSGVDNLVNHGLGRTYQGWFVVDKNANSVVWKSTTTNSMKNKQIILRASATVTAKIYIF